MSRARASEDAAKTAQRPSRPTPSDSGLARRDMVGLLIQTSAWIWAVAVLLADVGPNRWFFVLVIGSVSLAVNAWWLAGNAGSRPARGVPADRQLAEVNDSSTLIETASASEGPPLPAPARPPARPAAGVPPRAGPTLTMGDSVEFDIGHSYQDAMTRSGMFDASTFDDGRDSSTSHFLLDMVNRLDPRTLGWLESSDAEQAFLGWSIDELRRMSFLEIVHPDDQELAREQLRSALMRGEAHGLVYRVRTARGESKAIEMNVGVRYGPDRRITHLRCHVRDVTAKVKASRELRRRTRELTLVNQELRRTNRALVELKDRYGDLYQNAPAMYFSIDSTGTLIDCNNTMLQTLGYRRDQVVGKPYEMLLPEKLRPHFPARFAEFLRTGSVEIESHWRKLDGREIDVWISASAVVAPDGSVRHSRSVALDVTAQRGLEADLREMNRLMTATNEELSRKIKELDEFSYVVSHDLQEPLRTLIAFSDFLLSDCSEKLDDVGRDYVRHLVDASRRMRDLIQDLLALSRAGKVMGELAPVDLGEVAALVKADLAALLRTRGGRLEIADDLGVVHGDRIRVMQLLSNLVANGLKYNTNATPTVEVGRMLPLESDDATTFFVRDNGIGIDPRFHTRIFQLFRRLHTREEYEGTGAGLAICKKIVEAHGGKIWVESEPGQGSTFYVSLPRNPTEAPTPGLDAPP